MNPSDASRTALATSLMRAVHSRTAPAPLLDDVWGDRLVPEAFRAALIERALTQMDPAARAKAVTAADTVLDDVLRGSAAYADVILRARYTEDALREAMARGVTQYVIIGAGFDTFSCRRPAYADRLDIFEIDHPATQSLKRQRLEACGGGDPTHLHFIPADLAGEDLASALKRSSFRPGEPAFFSWLGVTVYLTREANLATLRAIASCAPPGSELVFSYVDEAVFRPGYSGTESFQKLRSTVSAMGESFLSGFDPSALGEQLRDLGLLLLEDLDGDQSVARYDPTGANGLRSNGVAHIAHARVVADHR